MPGKSKRRKKTNRSGLGGIVHTYQKYDPKKFPGPTQAPPDLVSPLMEHLLAHGTVRQLTEEEMARAVKLDPEQFAKLGPSLDKIQMMLEDRKRRILEKYETDTVQLLARDAFHENADDVKPPKRLAERYRDAVRHEQLWDMERLWYAAGDDNSPFARQLLGVMRHLGNKYEIDELAAKYYFTGNEPLTIEEALRIKEELEKIDELLEQIEEARETSQIAVLDLDELSDFIPENDTHSLEEMKRMVENYVREMAEQQGIEFDGKQFQLTPQAYRVFQNKLLARLFGQLEASRSGRHQANIMGDGAIELQQTKPYEFGDSVTQMDIPQTMINAMVRQGSELPLRLKAEDIEVHRTRNTPRCATSVIMDMSGSMRYDGQYINVKRMALALDGLIRSEYPGDFLNFIEMYTFGKLRRSNEIATLMPKPVTLYDPVVRLGVDMSRDDVSEHMVHQHFTNMQHSLRLARQSLAGKPTRNKQIFVITDGLPTAHYEDSTLYMLYPPHSSTEAATLREAKLCQQEGIAINMFLVPSWSQSEEDIRFAYTIAESTKGRVIFTSGGNLDRYVVWDYMERKREILG
ncbi:MAG: hypothetical protein ACR2NP_10270 [Pirellulaceae bacterium]